MRMKRKTTFRLAAAALAMTQLFTAAASAAFTNGFSWSYPVGEGLTYTRTEGKNTAGVQRANVLTYEPNTGVSPVMVYAGDTVYGSKATITNAVKYLQNQGKTVIGGTNADFFVMSSGVPIGLVIDKGTLISSDAWQYAVGFKKDGTARHRPPTMGIRITGAKRLLLSLLLQQNAHDRRRVPARPQLRRATHFAAKGSYIVLERENSTPVKAGGSVKLKVVSKGTGSSSFAIGENQMVLTKSDGANVPSWVDFPVGEEVTLSITAADPAWSEVEYAVGGKLLIDDSTVTTSGIDAASSRRARSAIGVKSDGTVVLYEIDGNQSSVSTA